MKRKINRNQKLKTSWDIQLSSLANILVKINNTKCKIEVIGVIKEVKLVLCGMKCVNLCNDVIKFLGICWSYDKKLENEKNFLNHIIQLQNVLNMWGMRNLSLLGNVSIFKASAFSKIVHLALLISLPSSTIDLLNKIQRDFLWNKKMQKLNIQSYAVNTPTVV